MPESELLKPCPVPWCGNITPQLLGNYYAVRRWAECPQCFCCGPSCTTEAEAIAAWNTRPADPVIELAQKVVDTLNRFESGRSSANYKPGELHDSIRALAAALPAREGE